jgi:radical SAM superfamily enzyme YgiQ (UPF0313 family)
MLADLMQSVRGHPKGWEKYCQDNGLKQAVLPRSIIALYFRAPFPLSNAAVFAGEMGVFCIGAREIIASCTPAAILSAMRVMLVYSNRSRILEPVPPIGLSYVATATRRAGHEVRFVDLMVSRNHVADLHDALAGFKPDVVGISVRNIDNVVSQSLAWHLGEVAPIIESVRNASRAHVVLGGPAISILKADALKRFDADFAVVGEGEKAFPRLLAAIAAGKGWAEIEGLCYREDGKVLYNEPVRESSFGASGMEQWVDWRAYERGGGTWAVHTKRGCPLHCVFCNYPSMEGHSLRRRDARDVVDEIEHVRRTIGPRTFEFTDSTFNIPADHAVGICEEIIRRGLKANFSAVGMNPLGMTGELMTLMKRAGFISILISPDAANETMLANLRKGFTMEDVRRSVRLARESGIPTTWFFLLGGPGETRETAEETIAFVENNLAWRKSMTIFMTGVRILPGTPLAKRATEEGVIQPGCDLVKPTFYFSPQANEQWVLDRINRAIARCPAIAHGAEENGSPYERLFYSVLHRFGAAPPYWRFLSTFLSIPPLPALRARHTGVRAIQRGHQFETQN